MDKKVINKLIKEYDEYLSGLRHVSCLGLTDKGIRDSGSYINYKIVDSYLAPKINDAHQQLIDQFINNMLGDMIGFSEVREVRNFIYYPDFPVKSHIENPANLYRNRTSIEKTVLITPTYELNLKLASSNEYHYAPILRVKRLELGPTINIFSLVEDEIDNYMLEGGLSKLISNFKENFGSEPTEDDIVLLRNIAIKYIIERVRENRENSMECLFNEGTYLSYNYAASKNNIRQKYNVDFKDKYVSSSSINSPWIYRGLEYFDNRLMMMQNGDDTIVPLIYQRTKK